MPEAFYTLRSLSCSHFGLEMDGLTNRPGTSCICDRSQPLGEVFWGLVLPHKSSLRFESELRAEL